MVNYLTIDNKFDEVKRANFFNYSLVSSIVWMCFHFTLVYFFLVELKSMLLVGLFLGLWNFISFLADSPIWVIQKYFDPKKIFLFWTYLMFIVSLIFVYFIYQTSTIEIKVDLTLDALQTLLSSAFNIVLLLIAVALYWIIKEIWEVTSFSYIMNKSDPSEYSQLFSKRNIYCWIWSLIWLIASWMILAFNTLIAVIILVLIIIYFIYFTIKYFDSSENQIKLDDIKNIKLITKESIINKKEDFINSIKNYKTTILSNKFEIIEKTKGLKVLFLKPIEFKNSINFKEIYDTTIYDMKSFYSILFIPPYNYRLLIMWLIFTIFWFWDTFVTSFLIDFLDWVLVNSAEDLNKFNLQNVLTAYVVIAIFAIPAYWAQIPLIKLWEKIWLLKVLLVWVLISGISIFLFWVFSTFITILILWIINSIWYAASMPISQWEFSAEYNNTYAEKKKLKQIDSNASSAPIKMISNLANVLWLVSWWILLQLFWYTWTFFVFWGILIAIFIISVVKRTEYKL